MQLKIQKEASGLDSAIDMVLKEMQGVTADSPEYRNMVDQLVKLYAMKESERGDRLHKDTIAIVLGNVLGILLIVSYERVNIMTSKALTLLFRIR